MTIYSQMNLKTAPLILVIFTIVCALPAAGVVIVPSAIAQEAGLLGEEDLVSGIISNVLDGSDDDDEADGDTDAEVNQDSTDTTTVNPNQEDQTVDQHDTVIYGDNTADLDDASVGVSFATPTTHPPLYNRLPPEEDTVSCFESELPGDIFCFDTLLECEQAEQIVGGAEEIVGSLISECEGFGTPPPDALSCSVLEDGQTIKCELRPV